MEIVIGLLIIAIGSFCQSSSYVPIKKVKDWSWESFWLVQGIFAWLIFPVLGAQLAVPEGQSLVGLYLDNLSRSMWPVFWGILWGVGGLTFGLSMRYLGVALGQSISLGTCAGLGTILGPVLLNIFFPELNALESLTFAVILGVVVTLVGIAVIGVAGAMKSSSLSEEEKKQAVKDFNFPKGLTIALLAGFMSGCFNVGLEFGKDINFGELTEPMFRTLPATLLVTLGGFITNAVYCFYQNSKNHTWSDYGKSGVIVNNLLFCVLAGLLWYSQFFGLSLGKGFLTSSPVLTTLAFCILMALNVVFSNVWGIILKEWKGCSRSTIMVLVLGLAILIISSFLPQLL
ncbi:MAG: L-rhamnose/proton symporter RhaT [Muribaculaceae bacterium]|nr:L-rhamnose/proton symporter RhaT [Muribaculaceae bacterium]